MISSLIIQQMCVKYNCINFKVIMTKSNNKVWIEPSIKELGSAKELIKGLSPVWDSKTSLDPSDQFDATAS